VREAGVVRRRMARETVGARLDEVEVGKGRHGVRGCGKRLCGTVEADCEARDEDEGAVSDPARATTALIAGRAAPGRPRTGRPARSRGGQELERTSFSLPASPEAETRASRSVRAIERGGIADERWVLHSCSCYTVRLLVCLRAEARAGVSSAGERVREREGGRGEEDAQA